MTLKTRRFLFLSFSLIFVIVTPLISLYAAGYKIGSDFRIQKTGILIIDSEPKNAQIFINDEIQQKFISKFLKKDEGYIKTAAKLKNIKPGNYKVRLELPGYWSWEKKLTIYPGQSTFAENIFLFKKDLPLKMIDGEFKNISLSPNKELLVAQQEEITYLLNLKNEEIQTINSSTSTEKQVCSWSPDSQKFLFNNQICGINSTDEIKLLNSLIGEEATSAKWDIYDKNKLYYSYNDKISCFDLNLEENKVIINNDAISDFFPKGDHLFFIEKKDNQSLLNIYDIAKKQIVKSINLPNSDYTFWNTDHNLLNLYDQKYNILYLVDPFSPIRPLYDTINNVTNTFWVNNDIMLFSNDFEIWSYSKTNQNKKLITRISDKINTIFWNHKRNYIIYGTNSKINVIDLDLKEKYKSTTLFEIEGISNLQINKEGDTLYFYSKIGNQTGLYKLSIQ